MSVARNIYLRRNKYVVIIVRRCRIVYTKRFTTLAEAIKNRDLALVKFPKVNPKTNLTGKVFGNLKVIKTVKVVKTKTYLCKCLVCGKEIELYYSQLIKGHYTSCGCMSNKNIKDIPKNAPVLGRIQSNKAYKNNKTGVKGVCYSKRRNKYVATIYVAGKRYNLGRFSTLEEAAQARKAAEEKYLPARIKELKEGI